ncbi:MAG: RrF2 family transcriptional regulator [Candidatus Methanoperedens sp.]|nr:RrF2 family transcriptional regulator [Candidatus Methanoperedens sp.]
MKLSTKGRYGLRAMVDLAVNSSVDHVALYSIAERQNISVNYLEQVFSILRKAGLVKSVKGAQGGYTLSDNPSNIKVGVILRALEGNLSVVDEESEDGDLSADSIQRCLKVNIWDKINDSINSIVDSLTLEELVDEYKKTNDESTLMFYI